MDYLNNDNDLVIENGDFKQTTSHDQDIQKILSSNVGDYKQFPTLGTSIVDFINSENPYLIEQRVRLQLKADNFSVNRVRYANGKILIDAEK